MNIKVAAIQLGAGSDKAKNTEKAVVLIKKAIKQKAKLICLPEVFNFRGAVRTAAQMKRIAESIPGESLAPLQSLAKENRVHILAGSIYECSRVKGKAYNTSVLISPTGSLKAKYRKINLFNAVLGKKPIQESKRFVPGKNVSVVNIDGWKAGMSICYDLRFSELYKQYAKKRSEVLFIPSAFTYKTGLAHWEILLRARAIESLSYVIAPNQMGYDERGIRYYGNSMIVSPWGEVLARAGSEKEQIIYANLTKNAITKARAILPSL